MRPGKDGERAEAHLAHPDARAPGLDSSHFRVLGSRFVFTFRTWNIEPLNSEPNLNTNQEVRTRKCELPCSLFRFEPTGESFDLMSDEPARPHDLRGRGNFRIDFYL